MKTLVQQIAINTALITFPAMLIAEIPPSDARIKDVARTYGFYQGQKYSLQEVSKKSHAMSRLAFIADNEFESKFMPSIKSMEEFMKMHLRTGWEKVKEQSLAHIIKNTNVSQLSESEAIEFINDVRKRAKGSIESPILETLLLFNPSYIKFPEREFLDGFKQVYSNDGSGKGKGISISIQVPKTWMASEGNRPNILQKFTSMRGDGSDYFMVMITDLQIKKSHKITQNIISKLIKTDEIQHFVPAGSTVFNSGDLTLEDSPGFWVHYEYITQRMTQTIKMESIAYNIFYNNKIIQLIALVGNTEPTEVNRFHKFKNLFDLMANSLVIRNNYK